MLASEAVALVKKPCGVGDAERGDEARHLGDTLFARICQFIQAHWRQPAGSIYVT